MDKLNTDKRVLKKFGITITVVFMLITVFIFIKHRHFNAFTSSVSLLFFILTVTAPSLLKPAYIFWMRSAYILSWINTRLILFLMFYLVFTPVGLIVRLFRVDLLERRLKSDDSYWKRKESKDFNPSDYQRQF